MDCAGDVPGMYIYSVGLRNSEDRIPAMSAHGGLKDLRISVSGSGMQKFEKLLTFSKRIYIHRKCLLTWLQLLSPRFRF